MIAQPGTLAGFACYRKGDFTMRAIIPKAMLLTAMCLALAACSGGGGGNTPGSSSSGGGSSGGGTSPTSSQPPVCKSSECRTIESSIKKIEDGEDKSATDQFADVVARIQKDDSDLTEDEKHHLLGQAQQKLNEASGATGAIARLFGNDLGVTECVQKLGENCEKYEGKSYDGPDNRRAQRSDDTEGDDGNNGETGGDDGETDQLVTLANTVFGYGDWATIIEDLEIDPGARSALDEDYALSSFNGTSGVATYNGDATGVAGKDGSDDTTSFDAKVELRLTSSSLEGDIVNFDWGDSKPQLGDPTAISLGNDKATSNIGGSTATGEWDFLAYGTGDNAKGPDGFLGAFFIRETGGGGDDFLTGGFDAQRSE